MLEILQYIISILTADATLTSIIPATQIFTGPVDVATEAQSQLLLPQINIHCVSESVRTVPINCRDTIIQIDIWSRNDMLEVINVYERILTLLDYNIANEGSAHIFWERLDGSHDQYESDRRIWHRSLSFKAWSQKP